MKKLILPSGHIVLLDNDVYKWASLLKWHIDKKGYARRAGEDGKWCFLHKLLIDCSPGMMRDHIDCNRLNNQRNNLRIVTPQQNVWNRKANKNNPAEYKGYKGIRLERGIYWRAHIRVNGKKKWLGYFPTPEDAARAYDDAARTYYGEYARTNFSK